jgi:hypothetical protein
VRPFENSAAHIICGLLQCPLNVEAIALHLKGERNIWHRTVSVMPVEDFPIRLWHRQQINAPSARHELIVDRHFGERLEVIPKEVLELKQTFCFAVRVRMWWRRRRSRTKLRRPNPDDI